MTKAELEQWFAEYFWPRYTGMLRIPFPTKWTGGARGAALTKILSLNPPEALRERILGAIQAQALYRTKIFEKCGRSAQKYDEFSKSQTVLHNREGKTWIFNRGWEDDIPSISEFIESNPDKSTGAFVCRLCNNHVKIKWTICKPCEKEYRKRDRKLHADNLEKMGISVKGRTLEEINRDIKDTKAVRAYFDMLAKVK